MLGPEVFDGIFCGSFELGRPYEEFIFRRDKDAEGLTVTDHVKYVGADDGRLSYDPNHSRPLG